MNYLRGVRKDVVGRGSCLHLSFIIHVGFSALQREPPLMLTGCWPHLISWTCDPGFSLIGLCLKMQFITRSGLTHNLCDGSAFLGLIWLSASLKLNRSDNRIERLAVAVERKSVGAAQCVAGWRLFWWCCSRRYVTAQSKELIWLFGGLLLFPR